MSDEKRRITDYNGLATYIGLPKSTLRARVMRNEIPFIRFGPRIVRFDLDAIDGWIASKASGAGGGR
jgi:excisionase family DNA binding protein